MCINFLIILICFIDSLLSAAIYSVETVIDEEMEEFDNQIVSTIPVSIDTMAPYVANNHLHSNDGFITLFQVIIGVYCSDYELIV